MGRDDREAPGESAVSPGLPDDRNGMVDRPAITALRKSLEQAVANNACLRAERDNLIRITEVTIADDKK